MDDLGFRTYLKRKGKKDHVIDGLIDYVRQFDLFLHTTHRRKLPDAVIDQVASFIALMDENAKSKPKQALRSLALYYKFLGQDDLSSAISAVRESNISKTRRVFPLKEFRGVDIRLIEKLGLLGIVTIEDMLEHGATPINRQRLAQKSDIPGAVILELVKLSDLARIGAVKAVRARLYYDAGVDTPRELAQWKPHELRKMLIHFIEKTGFDGIPPTPKETACTIAAAAELPDVIDYDPE